LPLETVAKTNHKQGFDIATSPWAEDIAACSFGFRFKGTKFHGEPLGYRWFSGMQLQGQRN
jgi:hypothetical protein